MLETHKIPYAAACLTEAYLQGLSIGMSSLSGSDSWMRFTLDPSISQQAAGMDGSLALP